MAQPSKSTEKVGLRCEEIPSQGRLLQTNLPNVMGLLHKSIERVEQNTSQNQSLVTLLEETCLQGVNPNTKNTWRSTSNTSLNQTQESLHRGIWREEMVPLPKNTEKVRLSIERIPSPENPLLEICLQEPSLETKSTEKVTRMLGSLVQKNPQPKTYLQELILLAKNTERVITKHANLAQENHLRETCLQEPTQPTKNTEKAIMRRASRARGNHLQGS